MPRYLVERTFADGVGISPDPAGAETCREVVRTNAEDGVTWVHSYLTPDGRRTWCGRQPRAVGPRGVTKRGTVTRDETRL